MEGDITTYQCNIIVILITASVILIHFTIRQEMSQEERLTESQRLLSDHPEQSPTYSINAPQQSELSQRQDAIKKESSDEQVSEDEADKEQQKKIKKDLNQEHLKMTAAKKMVVGTGFSMDVTQFFEFKKKEQTVSDNRLVGSKGRDEGIFQQISGSRIAWLILLYSVTTGAMIPGWIMNIEANKYMRICWKFMLQALTIIPFVFYEYRTADESIRDKYTLKHIFKTQNLVKPVFSSLANTVWFTMILFCFEWTAVSHAIVLGGMSNFFLSLGRSYNKVNHFLEYGGQLFILIGLFLVLSDSVTIRKDNVAPGSFDKDNLFYLQRQWWERVAFDLVAFSASFFTSQFSKYTSDLGKYYPPFLSMFIVYNLNWINMSFSSYFINGCEWTFDSFWGFFSIFSNKHFTGFLFMGILLSLGQMVSLVMVTRMFPDPIIPALATTLEPFIASYILSMTGIQALPGTSTLMGYTLFIPGMSLILVGQCLFSRVMAREKQIQNKSLNLMKQLKQVRERREERKKKRQAKEDKFNSIRQSQQQSRRNS